MSFKALTLIIVTLVYLYNLLLSVIRMRSAGNPIPANVQDVYDAETYKKWRAYHAEKMRHSILTDTLNCIISMALLAFNLYAAFAGLFPKALFWQMFAVLLLSALAALLLIPCSYYDTMVIEEKYGFNRSGKKTFWADQVKEFLVGLIVMAVVGSLLMLIHRWLGDGMILVFAALLTLLVLGLSFLYPLFSRIFNKFTPLEEGELKEKITALLEKNGYHVRAIKVMDASRRTTKTNAYFSGFGKMKTIVLFDTLLSSMTTDEICAVFAHEMGHGIHKDTLRNQGLSFLQMLILALLAWLTVRTDAIFTAFGFEGVNYGLALILSMTVEFALVSPLFGLIANYFSRRAEYRADAQAVKEGYGDALITGLKKLAQKNFAELAPSPLLVALEDSHPTISQRIDAIRREQKNAAQ